MNREIIFRALVIKSNDWVYGSVIFNLRKPKEENRYQLIDKLGHNWIVEGSSIGQFIGLQDSDNIDIYEGDVFKGLTDSVIGYEVFFENGLFKMRFKLENNEFYTWGNIDRCIQILEKYNSFTVIGNIQQNPLLINGSPK
jgi:YopX protein